MTSWQATSEEGPAGPDGPLRVIGLAAVCVGVAALAAATFVLSYQGIRAIALQAGIEPRYARGYPLLIDAMLVIVLAAVLALRGAGLPSRILAWLTLLIVLCAAAGADTLHATGRRLPHNAAAVTAAVLPWALVFVAFVLLLAILRYARLRRQASVAQTQVSSTPPADDGQSSSEQSPTAIAQPLPIRSPQPVRTPQPWQSVSIVPGFTSQLVSSAVAGAAAGATVADVESLVEPITAPQDADSQPGGTDHEVTSPEAAEPVAQEAAGDASDETGIPDDDISLAEAKTHLPALAEELPVLPDEAEPLTDQAEPLADQAEPLAGEDDGVPVFRRIRSSPTPPEE